MNSSRLEATQAVEKAREAIRRKDNALARTWAKRAARLDPTLEDAWLVLAAVSPPEESLRYLKRALDINPQSRRARQGLAWVRKRLDSASASHLPSSSQKKSSPKKKKSPWFVRGCFSSR